MRIAVLVLCGLCFFGEVRGTVPHFNVPGSFPDDWYGKDNWGGKISAAVDRDMHKQAGEWIEGLNRTNVALMNFRDLTDEMEDARRLLPRLVPRRRSRTKDSRRSRTKKSRRPLTNKSRRPLTNTSRRSLSQDSAQHVAVTDSILDEALDLAIDVVDAVVDGAQDLYDGAVAVYNDGAQALEDFGDDCKEFVDDAIVYVGEGIDDGVTYVGEQYDQAVQNADEFISVNVYGNEPQTIDNRPYPRIEPECRYDDSSGMPGLACLLNVEFSMLAVIQLALNMEFGLTEGGESVIAKISTGVKMQSIPENCEVFRSVDPRVAILLLPCEIATEAAEWFMMNVVDIGGLLHPLFAETIGIFPLQIRFPGKFRSGLIKDAYPLITLDLAEFTDGGICLTNVWENSGLDDIQKYTMMAASVLLDVIGGDLCFHTALDMEEINESGEVVFGMFVEADLFDKERMSFSTIIDFLPPFLEDIVDEVRQYLDQGLNAAMDFVKERIPEHINYDIDIFETLLLLMQESEGGGTTSGLTTEQMTQELLNSDGALATSGLTGDDTCEYHFDGVCDEPQYCSPGTDYSDCRGGLLLNVDGAAAANSSDGNANVDGAAAANSSQPRTNFVIEVGSSLLSTKKVLAPELGLICPELVTHRNWVHADVGGGGESFKVVVVGNRITVTRTDADRGWNIDLAFNCFKGFSINYYRGVRIPAAAFLLL
jgi:hypothetical protein